MPFPWDEPAARDGRGAPIVTLTLNPALDAATQVERLVAGPKLRCGTVRREVRPISSNTLLHTALTKAPSRSGCSRLRF